MSNKPSDKNELSKQKSGELLEVLKTRFEKNMKRHSSLLWAKVQTKLEKDPKKLWTLSEMERTGGQPDVVGLYEKTGEYIFCDCSSESPRGRRSLCYDRKALDDRKENKPRNSALNMANEMGIELMNNLAVELRGIDECHPELVSGSFPTQHKLRGIPAVAGSLRKIKRRTILSFTNT